MNEYYSNASTDSIKLPQIQLPTFGGNETDWTHFWHIYKSAIHDRKDLSLIQKFAYLSGQLVDQAKNLVDGLKLEVDNYSVCVCGFIKIYTLLSTR